MSEDTSCNKLLNDYFKCSKESSTLERILNKCSSIRFNLDKCLEEIVSIRNCFINLLIEKSSEKG